MLPVGRANIIREAQGCQLPPSVTSRVDRVVRDRALVGTQCHQGAGEAQHQYGRDCYEDQVNGPRVAASADKIEMSGAAFVSICVKVHSSGPLLHSEMHLEEHLVALALLIPCGRQVRSASDSFC